MRLASPAPSACAACYGQYPDRAHVDFEAAYDGPVLEGSVRVSIDDLVICEACMATAASMLGFVQESEVAEQLAEARRAWAAAEARNEGQASYIDKLEAAVQAKKALEPAPARRQTKR